MKNKFLLIITLLGLGLSANSCEELILDAEPANEPIENFDYLWRIAQEKYAFFEYKNIDWDEIYREYRPRVNSETGAIELFDILFEMLSELRDGHVNLVAPFNISRFNIDLLGPENIDFRLIRENYLNENYYITGPFQHDFLAGNRVAYVRYSSFSNAVSNFDMDFLFLRYEKTDGMIIDLRQNGGGNLSNVFRMLNRFVEEKTLVYNSFIKNGPGPEDFSAAQPAYLEPLETEEGEERPGYLNKPIMVLVDRGSYSATSFFALASLQLENFTLVGDTTGGGLGIPNGGQLPNGWTYRFSISRTLTPDGRNYENGVPVEEPAILTPSARLQGRDPVLDRAIKLITG